jgi:hypothetical protein
MRLRSVGGGCFLVAAVIFVIAEVRSLVEPGMMSHHQAAVGASLDGLPSGYVGLYLSMRKAMGGAFLASGLAMLTIYWQARSEPVPDGQVPLCSCSVASLAVRWCMLPICFTS